MARVLHDVRDSTAERRCLRRGSEVLLKWASGPVGRLASHLIGPHARGTVGVLMYHRISPSVPGVRKPTWNVPPERFRRQLAGLIARGYQAWPLARVEEQHARSEPFPARTFVITFDDGYENVLTHAWPILKDLRLPATVFLPTQFLDSQTPLPFETWPAAGSSAVPVDSWRILSTEQCRRLRDDGLISLGTHTHSHADFRKRPVALRHDLERSLDVFANQFNQTRVPLAFPYGRKGLGFSGGALSEAARQAGVSCALTTESDLIASGSDRFEWGRFTVTEADTASTLALKIDGWYGAARDVWRQCGPASRESVAADTLIQKTAATP